MKFRQRIPMPNLRTVGLSVLYICIILLISIVVYRPILNTFFVFDDATLINNLRYFKYFVRHLTTDWGGGFYRPLIDIFFYLDYQIWEKQPFGYHLTNVLFHAVNAVLVFFLTAHFTTNKKKGFLAGLIFAVHPSHAEAVAWISGRMDVVCSCFYLGSLLSFGLYRSTRRSMYKGLSLVFFVFALMTKELAITLPVVIILYDFCISTETIQHNWNVWKNKLKLYLPFVAIFFFYWVFRLMILGRIGGYGMHLSLKHFKFEIVMTYLNNLVYIINFPFPGYFQKYPNIVIYMLFIATGGLLLFIRSERILKFSILFTIVTLLPAWNLFGYRFQYLPSTGISIVFSVFILNTTERFLSNKYFKYFTQMIVGICMLLLFNMGLQEGNKWFEYTGAITNPHKITVLYPNIPAHSEFIFQGFPNVGGLRFEQTLNFYFEAKDLDVHQTSNLFDRASIDKLNRQYFFKLHQGELYDLSMQIRRQKEERFREFQIPLPEHPHNIVNRTRPQIAVDINEAPRSSIVEIVTALGNGIDIPQGTNIAKLQIIYSDKSTSEYLIKAGLHTADWAMEKPGIDNIVRHTRPNVWEARTITESNGEVFKANKYIAEFSLNNTLKPKQISITFLDSYDQASLEIYHVMLLYQR